MKDSHIGQSGRLIEADPSQTVLVIGAETLTKITDYTDRASCILFGDGAGAAVLRATHDDRGLLASVCGSDGSGADFMKLPAGGSASPATEQTVRDRMHYMKIQGRETFRFAVDHGQSPEGEWYFLTSREGKLKEGAESIQTDAFAICGLVEVIKLTGSDEAKAAARRTYRSVLDRLSRPGSDKTTPYPSPDGTKAQRVSMQVSLAFAELGKVLGAALPVELPWYGYNYV